MSEAKKALAELRDYVLRSTHWTEGGATGHVERRDDDSAHRQRVEVTSVRLTLMQGVVVTSPRWHRCEKAKP